MHPLLVLASGMVVVVGAILFLRLHAFLSLILGAVVVAALNDPLTIGPTVAGGFGEMCGKVGIVIAMAAIIGKCLLESGAAERIVRSILGVFGAKRLAPAFASSSFVVGIPVFFDTVFYLLMPIGRATAAKTGKNFLLYVLCIVAGATMAHSLVPPTPGPLFVAEALNVPLATMIAGGLVLGAITVSVGYAYAVWANRRWDIPMRESDLASDIDHTERDESELPTLFLSLLPIVLPVILLAGFNVVFNIYGFGPMPAWAQIVKVIGDKNIALTIAAIAALAVLVKSGQRKGVGLRDSIQSALTSGGVIILITAAGGAFGAAIRESGIVEWLQESFSPEASLVLLPVAFFLTTLVRIAQGSATVAMMTAVSIVGGLASGVPYHPLYLALAIGCGSKPIPWMNDSGFWIISRMSGMTERETLKTASVMMSLMGFAGLPVVMLGAWLLPMVPM